MSKLIEEKTTIHKLDLARIKKITVETDRISTVLKNIFNESADASMDIRTDVEVDTENKDSSFVGLDSRHINLVKRLALKKSWNSSDFQKIARELDLMPNGALEVINEWAFDYFGEAFAESGDQIEVNYILINQLRSIEDVK